MTEPVVDVLESVEIDRQQCKFRPTSPGGQGGLVDAVVQKHSVRQPCERVVQDLVEQRLTLALELQPEAGHPLVKCARHLDQAGIRARPHRTHSSGDDLAWRVQLPGLLLDELQHGVSPDQMRAHDVDDAELFRRGQVAAVADIRHLLVGDDEAVSDPARDQERREPIDASGTVQVLGTRGAALPLVGAQPRIAQLTTLVGAASEGHAQGAGRRPTCHDAHASRHMIGAWQWLHTRPSYGGCGSATSPGYGASPPVTSPS